MRKDMHVGGLFTADNVEPDGNGIFRLIQYYPDNTTLVADDEGVLSVRIPVYTDALRPAANLFPAGYQIWNSDEKRPQYAGGPSDNNWYNSEGVIT